MLGMLIGFSAMGLIQLVEFIFLSVYAKVKAVFHLETKVWAMDDNWTAMNNQKALTLETTIIYDGNFNDIII